MNPNHDPDPETNPDPNPNASPSPSPNPNPNPNPNPTPNPDQARAFEEGREFAKAIDAYLAVTAVRCKEHDVPGPRPPTPTPTPTRTPSHQVRCKEHDVLEAVWENAVKLAMNHVPERIGLGLGLG